MIDEEVGSKFLENIFNKVIGNRFVQIGIYVIVIGLVLGVIGYFIYSVIPKSYVLNTSGGDILSSRHFIVKKLQEEAEKERVKLQIHPTSGSLEVLEQVNEGKLDVAFIQGGIDKKYPNIEQVATLVPEMLHVLVRSGLDGDNLEGTVIDLGPRDEGTRIIGRKVLDYMGLTEGVSYVETNNTSEDLISMPAERLPDVIFNLSLTPSYIADYFVKEHDYKLMELPFPNSLGLREGWVADAQILAFTYSVEPAVPSKDIQTVGTNIQVVANKAADPIAISKMLEVLYSPAMVGKVRQAFNEEGILASANYPISAGTEMFMARKDPLFSQEDFEKIQGFAGIGVTLLSTILVVFRRMKSKGKKKDPTEDLELTGLYKELADMEGELNVMQGQGSYSKDRMDQMILKLNEFRQQVLGYYALIEDQEAGKLDRLMSIINDTRNFVIFQMQRQST
jgi:TRAP-type uncharacterized transport system substrate-binding protein